MYGRSNRENIALFFIKPCLWAKKNSCITAGTIIWPNHKAETGRIRNLKSNLKFFIPFRYRMRRN